MPDLGFSSHIRREEDANYGRCIETAMRNGHAVKRAEGCDSGNVGCKDCPWKKGDSNAK